MKNVLDKMLFSDVPFWTPQIAENHLRLMQAIVGHLTMPPIPVISVER
ncbi:hypothetical protein [Acetomicrobium sp.]